MFAFVLVMKLFFYFYFLKKEAMINKLCHELRVLSSYIEYFYQSGHQFHADAPNLYHFITYTSTWKQCTLNFSQEKYLLGFPKVINTWRFCANHDWRETFKEEEFDREMVDCVFDITQFVLCQNVSICLP